jgi:hypothetical protein
LETKKPSFLAVFWNIKGAEFLEEPLLLFWTTKARWSMAQVAVPATALFAPVSRSLFCANNLAIIMDFSFLIAGPRLI